MTLLLDTHIWLWWLTAESPLPVRQRHALDGLAAASKLGLAAISLWEAQMLHARGRLALPMPFADWLEAAADARMITTLPLDVPVVTALDGLPRRFHGDPADRLIVATARSHRLPLATMDASIRRSRVVPIWRP